MPNKIKKEYINKIKKPSEEKGNFRFDEETVNYLKSLVKKIENF